MARRNRRSKKVETMELDIRIPIPDEAGIFYVDLAQCVSLMNRKFIRQHQQFAVAGIELVSNGSGTVNVSRLKNDWVTTNALEKAYHIWRESQDQVLDDNPSIKATYNDFKVFMDATHAAEGAASNGWPIGYDTLADAQGVSASALYDWEYSEIQIPNDPNPGDTEGYYLHVCGPDNAAAPSKGIIQGYAESRSRPQSRDPNVVGGSPTGPISWMVEAFDDGDNLPEITADVMAENNSPPYIIDGPASEFEFYPGGSENFSPAGPSYAHVGALTTNGTAITRSPNTGPFLCMAGLLFCSSDVSGQSGSNVNYLKITMAAGPNKGLMSRPIVDVN